MSNEWTGDCPRCVQERIRARSAVAERVRSERLLGHKPMKSRLVVEDGDF